MSDCSDVEQSQERVQLVRESLPEVVQALRLESDSTARSWNIVQLLELLVDAGHFRMALSLSRRVVKMVAGDGRERLFKGYEALCFLMTDGKSSECIQRLEHLYLEIHNSGHSVADRVRIGLLLARALALCVGVGALSPAALLRARNVLSVELERVRTSKEVDLYAHVALELSKTYLHAPVPDALAAYSILSRLEGDIVARGASSGLAFDISRLLYQAAKALGEAVADESAGDEALLRDKAREHGPIAQALTELAIARRSVEIDGTKLESALDILEAHEFLSGAYEACFFLATQALDRTHNVVAERNLQRALSLAQRGGFQHGLVVARIGLFQSASISDNRASLELRCKELVADAKSEFVMLSSGLNIAAAQQITGDYLGALRTASKCQRAFEDQGLWGFASQALALMGSCQAQLGRWDKAALAWQKAYTLDVRRHAFIQGCERKALVVQALAMSDMHKVGHVRPLTVKKVGRLLEDASEVLRGCGESPDSVRVRGRLELVHAQFCVLTGGFVASLRHLSCSRELFTSIGMEFDVAMVDAFTGLSLMEVGKSATPDVLEEAVHTLQRSFQFFSSPPYPPIRWKLSYYLAMTALHISNNAGDLGTKAKWRDLSAGWTRTAEQDLELFAKDKNGVSEPVDGICDFSPGLNPGVIDALKRALGFKVRGAEKERSARLEKSVASDNGPVH